MPRNTFECILHYLHLCVNEQLDKQDRFSKFLPVIKKSSRRFFSSSLSTGTTNPSYDSLLRNSWQQETNKQQVDSRGISNLIPIQFIIDHIKVQRKENRLLPLINRELGDNVVLRLIECLTPTVSCHLFMANYFTSFRLFVCLATLELTKCEQMVCSTKIGYANTLSSGTNSCKKRNVATLNSAAHIKQKGCVTCRAGQNDNRVLYIAYSESCKPNRNFFGLWNKVERKYIQE